MDFHGFRGIPMGMEIKTLLIMAMQREWD